MINRTPNIADAIRSLAPNAEWSVEDENVENVIWLIAPDVIPTPAEILDELEKLKAEAENAEARLEADRLSAFAKLAKLGLTENEARAVIGF